MKTCLNLLVVLGAALLAAAAADGGCDVDTHRTYSLLKIFSRMEPCFRDAITEEMLTDISAAKDVGDFRKFSKDFCPHVSQVTTCMAGVRESLSTCQDKVVSETFTIVSELFEHLLSGVCEYEGERLAYVYHVAWLMFTKRDTLVPLRHCLFKAAAFLHLERDADLDLASVSHLYYREFAKYKGCMKYVEDEAYKPALQWVLDEIHATMKCKHPEEDRLVLCSEVDATKLTVSNLCQIPPLNHEHLYEHLEDRTMKGCYGNFFDHDKRELSNRSDITWLKEDYKTMCDDEIQLPECMLTMSAYGEDCLSQEENKQFQLEMQAQDDAIKRACVEDGSQLAEIMHHVYAMAPEHGHAVRDCYKSVVDAAEAHQGHAVSTKNMRFYHDATAFWQCLVGKMHENNDLASRVEGMMNDILKKMKCVNPEDGAVVSCESIHEHQH